MISLEKQLMFMAILRKYLKCKINQNTESYKRQCNYVTSLRRKSILSKVIFSKTVQLKRAIPESF